MSPNRLAVAGLGQAPPRLLHPIREACQILGGISRSSLYNYISNGRINVTHIGNRTFISHDELVRFVASLGVQP